VYATYIGGGRNEQPHSLFVDGQGNLVLAGRSNSGGENGSARYPTTGTGLIGTGGGFDIVVTKLNAAGNALIGSKKIGGSDDDGVNIKPAHTGAESLQQNYGDGGRSEVILDGGGNIYVASSSKSQNFPVTPGAFQGTIGGLQDGVILKFPPDVSALTFATYLGGSTDDAAYVLSLHPATAAIYVAGGTSSTNFPGISGTALNSASAGIDGYVSILSNNGASLLGSTYIGTSGTDQVYGIQFDRAGFPYVMGQTTGNWPVVNAAWSMNGGKQFIAKLRPDLSGYVYSTKFGTNSAAPNISPVAFLVDRCENVYVSGWGGAGLGGNYTSTGTTGLPIVNGLGLTTNDGRDFYFFVLKKDATSQLYGDVFGQNGGGTDHVDGGTSRFDADGVIYQAMCANCGGGPGMPAGGSWSPTNGSGNRCNLGLVKIALNLAGTSASIQSSINGVPRDSAGCVPLTVDFRDTLLNAVTYEWDFDGNGVTDGITNGPDTSYTYTVIGTYRVRLIAVDSSSCNIRDTSYINIKVGDLQALPRFRADKILPCEALSFQFVNTTVGPPQIPFRAGSFVWDFGDKSPLVTTGNGPVSHTYSAPGSYVVKLTLLDSNYCNAPDVYTQTISVAAFVNADFSGPRSGCTPFAATFKNESDGGQQFFWDFGDGSPVVTVPSPTHNYSVTTTTTFNVTLRVIDSATCNIVDDTTMQITVFGQPQALFSVSPQPPPVNTALTFTNLSSPDAVRFKWLFGDGDSLVTVSRQPVEHEYNSTKRYDARLIAYNSNNCADTFLLPVDAIVEPALDVPNAFTPLSGNENSIVYARGFAIGKMKFTIWNRWGQKVFETENRKVGWDGKYKNTLQPMDVYAYTLEVEFTDGTKASKKGDITLIR
jgi:gliding motility-associated-like protein